MPLQPQALMMIRDILAARITCDADTTSGAVVAITTDDAVQHDKRQTVSSKEEEPN